jgi:hypothetical protein
MTEHDVLSLHVDALRQRSRVAGEVAGTQQRIVATLRARRRRKKRAVWALIWAGLALPCGSTAYAWFYGMPPALRPVLERIGLATETAVPHARDTHRKRSSTAAPTVAVVPSTMPASTGSIAAAQTALEAAAGEQRAVARDAASDPGRSADGVASMRSSTAPRRSPRAIAGARPAAAPDASSAESHEELSRQLYARAHELHFVARDADAALRAWDHYLARAPLQVLRVEAEYNRALCLVRLGPKDEAMRALAPFADGTHGAYRRRESAALIRALSR